MDITLKSLKNVCTDIEENWGIPNDSHTEAEYNGMCKALDMIQKHYQELQDNDNSKPQYTYDYGDECNDIWDRFNMTVRDDNDRIKLKFVAFQGEGSYE